MRNIITKIINFLKNIKQEILGAGFLVALFIVGVAIYLSFNDFRFPKDVPETTDSEEESDCNVMGIDIRGKLVTYVPRDKDGNKEEFYEDTTTSENVLYSLKDAENNDDIKGVLIEVDSYGGSPVAGEEIANEIKLSQKPVVAFIRDGGVSASYLAISSADKIFASKNSEVGSIGVTMSYVDNVSKNQKDGYSFIQLSAGKFKDAGNSDKPLTQEEKDLFMRDVQIMHENFIKDISDNRNIAIEKVREIADGSTVLGERAKELGLIDEIGGYNEAQGYLVDKIREGISICW